MKKGFAGGLPTCIVREVRGDRAQTVGLAGFDGNAHWEHDGCFPSGEVFTVVWKGILGGITHGIQQGTGTGTN